MVLLFATWIIALKSISGASLEEATKDSNVGYSDTCTSSEEIFPVFGSGFVMNQRIIDTKDFKDNKFDNICHDMIAKGQKYRSKSKKNHGHKLSGNLRFGDPYRDRISSDVTAEETSRRDEISGSSTSQLSNILCSFTVADQLKNMRSDRLGKDRDAVLSEKLELFARPDCPTHLMRMDRIQPNTIDWLWNFSRTCTGELSPHIEALTKLSIAKDFRPWELRILDKFIKFKPAIKHDKEWVRRYQAFRYQLYPQVFCKLWQEKKNSVSADTREFVHTLHLHKPHPSIISLASKKEIETVTKFLGKVGKPDDLNQAFTQDYVNQAFMQDYVDSVIELFQLRERQLNISGSKCVFGPEFLFIMRTQGINETLLIRLEIILELSSPNVQWASLHCDEKIAKSRNVLNAISDFAVHSHKDMEGVGISTQIEPTWESHFVSEIMHRNPEFSELIKGRVKILIRALADCNNRPLTFHKMFWGQESAIWRDLKVHYQEALAAAISGLQLKELGSIKSSMKKFPVGSIKKKCLYWKTPYLKDVDFGKLKEYSETLGTHMLKFNNVDEEGIFLGED